MLNEEQRHSLAVRVAAALAPEDQAAVAAWGRGAMLVGAWTEETTAAAVLHYTVETEMFNNQVAAFLFTDGPELPDVPALTCAMHACVILKRLAVKEVMTLLVRVDAAAFLDEADPRMKWELLRSGGRIAGMGAAGKRDRYVIVPEDTAAGEPCAVRLTRWPIETAMHDPFEAGAAAARNVIVFPLGRGPGRPAGELEAVALIEAVKVYAEAYEGGESIEGYPCWQRAEPVRQVGPCPDCGSPQPFMHPAAGDGGEVTRLCGNSFHAPDPVPEDVRRVFATGNSAFLQTGDAGDCRHC